MTKLKMFAFIAAFLMATMPLVQAEQSQSGGSGGVSADVAIAIPQPIDPGMPPFPTTVPVRNYQFTISLQPGWNLVSVPLYGKRLVPQPPPCYEGSGISCAMRDAEKETGGAGSSAAKSSGAPAETKTSATQSLTQKIAAIGEAVASKIYSKPSSAMPIVPGIAISPQGEQAVLVSSTCGADYGWRYNPYAKKYDKVSLKAMSTEYGVWVRVTQSCSMTYSGSTYLTADNYLIGLVSGWHAIPAPKGVTAIKDIAGDCSISFAYLFDPSANQWKKVTDLAGGYGYFVKTDRSCTLRSTQDTPPVPPLPDDTGPTDQAPADTKVRGYLAGTYSPGLCFGMPGPVSDGEMRSYLAQYPEETNYIKNNFDMAEEALPVIYTKVRQMRAFSLGTALVQESYPPTYVWQSSYSSGKCCSIEKYSGRVTYSSGKFRSDFTLAGTDSEPC